MKYSFMSFSCPDLTLREILCMAEELGYQGFEPRVDCHHAHGIELSMTPAQQKEALLLLDASSVKLSCLATSVKLASKTELSKQIESAKRAISVCEALHIPSIRLFGGPIEDGDTREAAKERMADALDRLSAWIGDMDITLCMETHDAWCDPADAADVMKRCSGKHAGINWDVMHTRCAAHKTEQEAFDLLCPYIRHVHMHGGTYIPKMTFLHIGDGDIDHRMILKLLHSAGYKGYLSGEWIHWDEPNHLQTEIETMHRYEKELFGNTIGEKKEEGVSI